GLGSNSVTVSSYTPIADRLQGRFARLTQDDLDLLSYRVEGIASITPIMYLQAGQVRYGSLTAGPQVIGTTYSFQDVGQFYAREGRFISDSDNKTRRRVAVIGNEVRQDLGLPADPVGEFVQINGEWPRISGLLETKGEILGNSQDNLVMLPYTTMHSLSGGNRRQPDMQIQLTLADLDEMDGTIRLMERLLRDARNIAPDAEDDFRVQTAEQL